MKTTIDLPEDLLIKAKTVAVRRHTTLKAIVEKALRRELAPPPSPVLSPEEAELFDIGPLGLPVLKQRESGGVTTLEMIRAIQDEIDEEELQNAMNPRRA